MKLLLVEDEQDVRESLAKFLRANGLTVTCVQNGAIAISRLASDSYDLIVTDIRMPELGGIELLRHVKSHYPTIPVIIITAFGTIEDAVECIRMGAHDYVVKPLVFEDILQKVLRVLDNSGEISLHDWTSQTDSQKNILDSIVGDSSVMRELKSRILRIADSGSSVVIHGASGTGKELVARALHGLSTRAAHSFIAVNCAAIPETLLESQFFGYVKGAFTGAATDRAGLFESAQGGTLFLDEISELPLNLQAKLLRVVEEREVTPLGSTQSIKLDVAIISASSVKLKAVVESRMFREDLYFRLNVIELFVPPLRERTEDIPKLAEHFLRLVTGRVKTKVHDFSRDVLSAFLRYDWPGNIRELRNVVERSVVLSTGAEVQLADLPEEIANCIPDDQTSKSHKDTMRNHERDLILKALQSANFDKKTAANLLGMGLSTLYRKLEEFEIE